MRLFIAVPLPDAQKASIEKALQGVREFLPEARWTPVESWHVTLEFLGHTSEDMLEVLGQSLAEVTEGLPAMTSHLTGAGAFPGRKRARVMWMGLADEASAMADLAGRLDSSLEAHGFKKQGREFRPHLTLARFNELRPSPSAVGRAIDELNSAEIDRSEFPVDEIVLFQSHLSPKGTRYEPLLRLKMA